MLAASRDAILPNAIFAPASVAPETALGARDPRACTYAMHHQFYNSPFNIVALAYLARVPYPQRFAHLDPDASYRDLVARYTDLPAAPFLFYMQRHSVGQDRCTH